MSLNSYATPDGLEIGRAQAVQAEAAGIPCHSDMNPILLKPTSENSLQIVLTGRPQGNLSARDYLKAEGRETLFAEVNGAYQRLSSRYKPIAMEGAGSISELNLRHRDICNIKMALEAQATVYLITDIERGGIFASCSNPKEGGDQKIVCQYGYGDTIAFNELCITPGAHQRHIQGLAENT